MKIEKRNCPFCQRTLDIPSDARKFTCVHCGKNLTKVDKPSVTKVFDTKDEIDFAITKKTMFNFVMQPNTEGLIFKQGSDEKNRFTGYVLELTQSLLKANSHRRKYLEIERKEIADLIAENEDLEESYVGGANSIELHTEFDGFLVHIKSALDSLAKTTKPLFGFGFEKWEKSKDNSDGKSKSGVKILNSLKRNLGSGPNEYKDLLIKLIEDNLEWLTFIVELRDKPVHKGKSASSDLVFNYATKIVTPQMLHYSNKTSEQVKDFMTRIIQEVLEFIHKFLFLTFNSKLPPDIKFGFDDKGDACWQIAIPPAMKK